MTYSTGGNIQATDYNTLVSTGSPNLNNIWSTGSGSSGYGQTALPTVAVGDIVSASTWSSVITAINAIANHQGSVSAPLDPHPGPIISAMTPAPVAGNSITPISNLSNNLTVIDTNKGDSDRTGSLSYYQIATTTVSWDGKLTFTFTITFGSHNQARYFFNAGGRVSFEFAHNPALNNTIDLLVRNLCNCTGDVFISSAGTNGTATEIWLPWAGSSTMFNGVTKVDGLYPQGTIINGDNGFYALNSTPAYLITQYGYYSFLPYSTNSNINIKASYNNSGVLTVTGEIDIIPDGALVQAGTTGTVRVYPPDNTYLSNTWGTPTLSATYTTTPAATLTVTYFIQGGGGGGAGTNAWEGGGGGGAGGLIISYNVSLSGVNPVIVGAGGGADTNGSDSTFNGKVAYGGGHGAHSYGGWADGADGGCGGGGSKGNGGIGLQPGSFYGGYGYDGGFGPQDGSGGGGGGVGGVGQAGGNYSYSATLGGAGSSVTLFPGGARVFGQGGGGGGMNRYGTGEVGVRGGWPGGGGGGQASVGTWAPVAQYGTVYIQYPGTVPKATGGTVTIENGLVHHVFYSSGDFIVTG